MSALLHVMFAEGIAKIEPRIASLANGIEELKAAVAPFSPSAVTALTGVPEEDIVRIARELCAAPTAAVYGRIGVNTVSFGTTNAWLVNVLNIVTGNFDKRGGAMLTTPLAGSATTRGTAGKGKGFATGRGHSRVSKKPEVLGEYPVAVLGEEMLTPGENQIRAAITVGGNPVMSTPHSAQLDTAFAGLEFMVSVDIYLNETTRHADVILPSPSALEKDHYDLGLYTYAVRNVGNYSQPVLKKNDDQPDEWEILVKLGGILQGLGADCDVAAIDDNIIAAAVTSAVANSSSPISGRDADEILALLSKDGRRGTARMLDFMLQVGPYGAAFGTNANGISLDVMLANPHGVDMGPLEPRFPEALRTPSGRIEVSPPQLMEDMKRLYASLSSPQSDMVLVGRRELKSNNSWMHNIKVLTKGSLSCTAHVHPHDAQRFGLSNGSTVRITSRVGSIDVPVEITDAVRQGVVSVPHGWGHGVPGTRMGVAAEKAGVNSNILTDDKEIDPLSGNAVLNAIPVTLVAV
jgi:anaerobic selenocysteine-containing dehydrogenase